MTLNTLASAVLFFRLGFLQIVWLLVDVESDVLPILTIPTINSFQHFVELSSKHGNGIRYAFFLFIITLNNTIVSICDKGNALVLFITTLFQDNFKSLEGSHQLIHFHRGDIMCFFNCRYFHIKPLGKRPKKFS
jgi:hypothetical protein